MKKFSLAIATLLVALCVVAQTKFWVCNNDGTWAEYLISNVDSISFTNPIIEKCKASDYPQVTIGTQIWMAENYRCSKYDTESEAYNASWLTNNTIPVMSAEPTYTPCYNDATDRSIWNNVSRTHGSVCLTNEQIAKLGYSYNWAAAVGVADGREQTTAFSGKRQGICPNGWHLPSNADWNTLAKTFGRELVTDPDDDTHFGYNYLGLDLKSKTGWYSLNGTDEYGFSALPAGCTSDGSMAEVGLGCYYWTVDIYNALNAWVPNLSYDNWYLIVNAGGKRRGFSVRCLKD